MESVLEKYILDSVDYEQGIIEFSSSKLEISIKKGEVFQGSFQVKNSLLKEMHAELFSSSLRLTCDKYVIDGAENTDRKSVV